MLSNLIEERRKIPKADRLKQFRNDSVDEIDTTDLENFAIRGMLARDYEKYKSGELYDENNPVDVMNRKLQQEAKAKKKIEKSLRDRRGRDRDDEGSSRDYSLKKLKRKQEILQILNDGRNPDHSFSESEEEFEPPKTQWERELTDDEDVWGLEEREKNMVSETDPRAFEIDL